MDRESPKILVVTGRYLHKGLMEYALTVAKRLDLEIVLLFVDEKPTCRNSIEKRQARESLESKIKKMAAEFSALAWEQNIVINTIVNVGSQETAIKQARKQDPEIRFLLRDAAPHEKDMHSDEQYPQLTVLRSSEQG